jgi:hypothetical protein
MRRKRIPFKRLSTTSHYADEVTGEKRRHHFSESVLQRAFKEARIKAGMDLVASAPLFAAGVALWAASLILVSGFNVMPRLG